MGEDSRSFTATQAPPQGGRPRADDRKYFEGILWILWIGAPWSELPRQYGSPSTCWRRLREWEESGVLLKLWRAFLAQLNDQQKIRSGECFADGSFAPAKKGAQGGQDQKGQGHEVAGSRSMARVLRSRAYLDLASPAEGKLLEKALDTVAVRRAGKPGRLRKRPERLITDRAFESNPLRRRLKRRGMKPILPARKNHRRATDRDGRKLRQYKRRWIVERTFAWLGHFRRLVVRYERLITTYAGFFHMACALLTLRRVLK